MYKGMNLIIPLCAPVQFTVGNRYKQTKTIGPYVLGALLGDGCITCSVIEANVVQLTTMDDEIVQKFVHMDMTWGILKQKPKAGPKVI